MGICLCCCSFPQAYQELSDEGIGGGVDLAPLSYGTTRRGTVSKGNFPRLGGQSSSAPWVPGLSPCHLFPSEHLLLTLQTLSHPSTSVFTPRRWACTNHIDGLHCPLPSSCIELLPAGRHLQIRDQVKMKSGSSFSGSSLRGPCVPLPELFLGGSFLQLLLSGYR